MKNISRRDFLRGTVAMEICAGSCIDAIAQIGRFTAANKRKLKEAAFWKPLAGLNQNIPLHYLRFFPAYKLKHLPVTPVHTLETARKNALKEGLKYVYLSNLPGHMASNTYCPRCSKTLIERIGFKVISNAVRKGLCPYCQYPIAGLW